MALRREVSGGSLLIRGAALLVLMALAVQYILYFRGTFTEDLIGVIFPSSFLALLIMFGAYVVEGGHALITQIKAAILVIGLLFLAGYAFLAAL